MRWTRWLRRSTPPTVEADPAWLRSIHLEMLYLMDGETPELDNCGFVRYGLFEPTRDQRAIIRGITNEDYALFSALREAAVEHRDRQYDALERLAVLLAGDGGLDVQARWGAAIDRNPEAVEECMIELGWLDASARGD